MAAGSERAGGRLLLVEQLVRLFLNQFVGVSKAYLPGSHVHQSRSHNRVSELLHMGVEGNSVGYPDLQIVTDDIPGGIALERFEIQSLDYQLESYRFRMRRQRHSQVSLPRT